MYDDGETSLYLSYQTAWGPSIPIIKALLEQHDFDLEYSYYESGMGFAGIIERNGDNYKNESIELDDSNKYEYYSFLIQHDLEDTEYLEDELGLVILGDTVVGEYTEEYMEEKDEEN